MPKRQRFGYKRLLNIETNPYFWGMNNEEITQDDLYDLGFEPMETESTKTIDYEHKELGIKLWRGMAMVNPESKYWKTGYGKDKINFQTLDQLKEYMDSVRG